MTALATPADQMSDEWQSPRKLVLLCDQVFGPYVRDCAAAPWNHQFAIYFTEKDSFFDHQCPGRNWLNPEYSRGQLDKFVGRARAQVVSGPADLFTLLVPMYPSEGWWRRHVARPEGQPLGCTWLWGRYPAPLDCGRRMHSAGLTIDVFELKGRQHFTEKSGQTGPARFGSAIVNFWKPGVLRD